MKTIRVVGRLLVLLLGALVLFLGGELIAAALTGRVGRAYRALAADASVTVGEEDVALPDLAAWYRPTVRVNPAYVPPAVETIWYQAVEGEDSVTLVYYLDWQNEIHPRPVWHLLYEIYRQAVYGSAHDIEYIEVTVDRASGAITRVRFETSPDGPYERDIPVHLYVLLDQNGAGYRQIVTDASGHEVQTATIPGVWDADHPVSLGVMTWNHVYTLLDGDPGPYADVVQAPLRYLTDDVYSAHKFARRSQGDVVTVLDETPRAVLRVLIWGSGLLFGYGWLRRGK